MFEDMNKQCSFKNIREIEINGIESNKKVILDTYYPK